MKLTGDQITALADFADGADCQVYPPEKGMMGGELRSRVKVKRIEDKELVHIYDDGGMERVGGQVISVEEMVAMAKRAKDDSSGA